jgi:hypothetical protein
MPRNGKLPEKATFFLMFVTVLLAAQFRSKRFAEYFPPFAVLFLAFSWQAFDWKSEPQLPEDVQRELNRISTRRSRPKRPNLGKSSMSSLWALGIDFVRVFRL